MYCYQCGKKIIEGANFCHFCGADQRLVDLDSETDLTKNDPDNTQIYSPTLETNTKGFELSGLSEEEDLHRYLSKVDNKVKKNVEAFETKDHPPLRAEDLSLTVSPEYKEPNEDIKKKRTFKQIWKDFLNEEDNPYSVFGDVSEKENPARSNTIEFKQTEDLNYNLKEEEVQPTTDGTLEENKPSFKDKIKDSAIFLKLGKIGKYEKKPSTETKNFHQDEDFITDLRLQEALIEDEGYPSHPLPRAKEPKPEDISTKSQGKDPISDASSNLDQKMPRGNKNENKTNLITQLDSLFDSSSKKYSEFISRISNKSPHTLGLIFLMGMLFSIAPIFIIQKTLGLAEVFLSIFKVLIGLFTFYYANFIARKNTLKGNLNPLLNRDTVIHWSICQAILLVTFFIYPSNFVMGHNLLGALTPHFISSLFIFGLAAFLSITSVYQWLSSNDILEYFGWFSIVFVIIELFSKLFWVIITFLSTSVL